MKIKGRAETGYPMYCTIGRQSPVIFKVELQVAHASFQPSRRPARKIIKIVRFINVIFINKLRLKLYQAQVQFSLS